MAQHFLLSAAARTLSIKKIYSAGEQAAYETFLRLRWPETDGEAVCPDCGCYETYSIATRRRFKCKADELSELPPETPGEDAYEIISAWFVARRENMLAVY